MSACPKKPKRGLVPMSQTYRKPSPKNDNVLTELFLGKESRHKAEFYKKPKKEKLKRFIDFLRKKATEHFFTNNWKYNFA